MRGGRWLSICKRNGDDCDVGTASPMVVVMTPMGEPERGSAGQCHDRCHDRVMANTERRTVRIDTELWGRAGKAAATNGETLSDVIRRALDEYARKVAV